MKTLLLIITALLLISCDNTTETELTPMVDTVYVEAWNSAPSDSINLICRTPARFYVEKGGDSVGNYVYYVSDDNLIDSNSIAVKKVKNTGEFTSLVASVDDMLGAMYNNHIIVHNPSDNYGYFYDEIKLEWKVVEMDSVLMLQVEGL